MYGYIYETTNLINGKKYIGQHKSEQFDPNYLGSGTLIRRSIKKYGFENFKVKILCKCNSYEELLEKEQYYIALFRATESDEFYNIVDGGFGGWKKNGVSIKKGIKISKQARINTSNAHKGIRPSEETRRKMAYKLSLRQDQMAEGYRKFLENNPHPSKGDKYINNGIEEKRLNPDKIQKYLDNGWKLGRLWTEKASSKGKRWITNGVVNKFVKGQELEDLLNNGFKYGKMKKSK